MVIKFESFIFIYSILLWIIIRDSYHLLLICYFIKLSSFLNWMAHASREALDTCVRAISISSRLIRYPNRKIGISPILILSLSDKALYPHASLFMKSEMQVHIFCTVDICIVASILSTNAESFIWWKFLLSILHKRRSQHNLLLGDLEHFFLLRESSKNHKFIPILIINQS
jgi:hypothetical protein